ncbi:DUF1674 domain-containing protein [Nitratireductor sp. StC3]|uniref:DUF1674 domain-containing protein n=1 Tax=Nitratireductor sp. StC3 TaxID=2126741 RepID=UPI000D0CC4A8|nr:DUF1674 domain-containing protein [Nitratireductor sp. StC3]PSM19024.1 DUF1674 domain-containing protein [Nitratireductor sp. StC3]
MTDSTGRDDAQQRRMEAEDASRPLPPQARRALAEAEARRAEYRKREAERPSELGGRGGLEPGRYGDWEVKGIATDF